MAVVNMTDARKSVLEALIENVGKKNPIGKRARAVLLCAAGTDVITTAQQVGLSMNRVRSTLQAWREAEKELTIAERKGKKALLAAIQLLFDEDDGCCCGCDAPEDEFGLDSEELNALAYKVFELLNYELRVERERLGYLA